jgi:hypothetical protein
VKEPCISVPFQEGFDLSSFIPLKLFLPQNRNGVTSRSLRYCLESIS